MTVAFLKWHSGCTSFPCVNIPACIDKGILQTLQYGPKGVTSRKGGYMLPDMLIHISNDVGKKETTTKAATTKNGKR
jgi:hypothetical protein